ncbi:MAG: disulfide bond formation protein B [Burkholderiales bacterium]|nr:disulfide bond formation protein B [Burkholderiales bacterium]
MRPAVRIAFAAIAVVCASLLAYAIYYLQEELGLEPCPMCILQRFALIAVGVTALVAAIHGPRAVGLKIYSGLIVLFAVAGGGVSIRHSYLQHFPPKVETCGSDLGFLVNNFPFTQALPKIFAGTGSCSKVDWKFIGLSIPEWTLVWFVIFAAVAIWAVAANRARQ